MSDIVESLKKILGPQGVLTGPDAAARDTGWGRREPCLARAVVLPRSTADVSRILRACHAADQPVVAQGGMTGLVEGAVPTGEEIGLSLERMRSIEELDEVGRTMTVQAGVPLQAVQERAASAGLMFPLDLGARGSCTLGGNLSTNAGGNRVLRYGMAREQVLGLEAVLADGTVVSSMNRMIKNNAGYDLKHLFIGSEGTLGIVTRAVLRLRERPLGQAAALISLPDFRSVTGLLHRLGDLLGGSLSAFEVMWEEFYRLVTTPPARGKPPLPHGEPFYVLAESLGADPTENAARLETALARCDEEGLVTDAVLAPSGPERDRLWELRDDVEQLFQMEPLFVFDVSLAIRDMEAYVGHLRGDLSRRWPDHDCVIFGHLGDGNLHLAIRAGVEDSRPDVERLVYDRLRDVSGSVSAEHGIGLEKRAYLPWSRGDAEIELMRRLKEALDPKGILNPGRVIPPRPGSSGSG